VSGASDPKFVIGAPPNRSQTRPVDHKLPCATKENRGFVIVVIVVIGFLWSRAMARLHPWQRLQTGGFDA